MTETTTSQSNNRLIKNLAILAIFFAILGLIVLIMYLLYWRYEEVTDDAYVNGNRIQIVSQIQARALSYFADNTNYVIQGQPLVQLDSKDFEIAFEQALSNLAITVRDVRQLIDRTKEQKSILEQKTLDYERLQLEYVRRKEIVKTGAVAQEEYTNALAAMDNAKAAVNAAGAELHALQAVSETVDVASHPFVQSSIQKVKQSYLDLVRCTIYAPVSGFVAQRAVQVGQWVTPQDTLLNIIPLDQIWVDANYKETQLAHVRIGQAVSLVSDIYGKKQIYQGTVVGIGAGTGAVFSILPPQNATGNWIKIVQRVPVKISLDTNELYHFPLSLGFSMTSTIDTHDRTGPRLATLVSTKEVAETPIYKNELDGIDERIHKILSENGAFL